MCGFIIISRYLFLCQCIEGVIGGTDYNQNKVNQWTATIVEHSLTQLVKQGRPFKYIGKVVKWFCQRFKVRVSLGIPG